MGSCTTKGLTDEEIAQQDERFFLAIEKLKWLRGRRDVRVFEWKPINIYNSLENVSPKQSHEINHFRKRMKNT
ncbi:ABC transporter ATP-binding protein [Acinetobacter junii]|nr:ABC transporter ATP-binding protein [Acinetobacter junii]